MSVFDWFLNKTGKIMLIPLSATILNHASIFLDEKNNESEIIAGTPEQIEKYLAQNPSRLPRFEASHISKVVPVNVNFRMPHIAPFNWSYKFDNKEGMAVSENQIQDYTKQLTQHALLKAIDESYSSLDSSFKHIFKTKEDFAKWFYTFGGTIIVRGDIIPTTSCEGTEKDNSNLGQKRGHQYNKEMEIAFSQVINDLFGNGKIKVIWNPQVTKTKIIYNEDCVIKAANIYNRIIKRLYEKEKNIDTNWVPVNLSKLTKGDVDENHRFTLGIRSLQLRFPKFYKLLIDTMGSARRVDAHVKFKFVGGLDAVEIVIKKVPVEQPLVKDVRVPIVGQPLTEIINTVPPPEHRQLRLIHDQLAKLKWKEKPFVRQVLNKNVPRDTSGGSKFIKI